MQHSLISILGLMILLPYVVSFVIFSVVHKLNMPLATVIGLVAIPLTFLLTVTGVLIPVWHEIATDGFSILFYFVVAFGIAAHITVGLVLYSAVILYTSVSSTAKI